MSDRHSTPRRAVAYYRMSTLAQEASIPEQRQWCREAAQREGVDILSEFSDEGISGSEVERRPGLMKMVEFCERQPKSRCVEAVVCWDADRFSRASSIRTAAVLDDLMNVGIRWMLTCEGWIDLEDETDLLVFNVKQDTGRAAFARKIAQTVTRNAIDRAKAGKWVAGKPPYGYVIGADGKLAPAEPAASVIRRLFARALAGDSLAELARWLNESGAAPPAQGKRAKKDPGFRPKWCRSHLARILRNRNYVGDLVWNKRHHGKYQRVKSGRMEKTAGQRGRTANERNAVEDLVIIEGTHPAIIDRATFDAVGARLASRRWKFTAPCQNGEWIFSGLVRCGDCGAKMYGYRDNRRHPDGVFTYRRYACSGYNTHGKGGCRKNATQQDLILAAVLAELQAIYAEPGRLARLEADLVALAADSASSHAADLARIETTLTDLDAKIARAEENILLVPAHQVQALSRRLDAWRMEREQLAASRDGLAATESESQAAAAQVRDALAALADLGEHIEDIPPREARRVVERLVTKVTVIFDHSRPHNQCHASQIEIELHPDVNNLLRTGRKKRPPSTRRSRTSSRSTSPTTSCPATRRCPTRCSPTAPSGSTPS